MVDSTVLSSCNKLDFEETELRLGLPGEGEKSSFTTNYGKRSFHETADHVDLKLNLSNALVHKDQPNDSDLKDNINLNRVMASWSNDDAVAKPPAKAQVVGWPPVRSFRKNAIAAAVQRKSESLDQDSLGFVKVSMDGAPYLRKVDLKIYKSYQQLYDALCKMFTVGMVDYMNESKQVTDNVIVINGCECVTTFEDKDGDWMLVSDVPWEMFVESCKRLRIMKGADAKGIGQSPRSMEKSKSQNKF